MSMPMAPYEGNKLFMAVGGPEMGWDDNVDEGELSRWPRIVHTSNVWIHCGNDNIRSLGHNLKREISNSKYT